MTLVDQPISIAFISLISGLAILFFGRRLFWLYIGVLGMLIGFELAELYLPAASQWVYLVCGALLGIVSALLSMAMQYVAVAMVGFAGGAYLAVQIIAMLPELNVDELQWLLVVPAVIGAIFSVLVFDITLIILSSLTGAMILVQLAGVGPLIQNLGLVLLTALGLAVQYSVYRKEKRRSG